MIENYLFKNYKRLLQRLLKDFKFLTKPVVQIMEQNVSFVKSDLEEEKESHGVQVRMPQVAKRESRFKNTRFSGKRLNQ